MQALIPKQSTIFAACLLAVIALTVHCNGSNAGLELCGDGLNWVSTTSMMWEAVEARSLTHRQAHDLASLQEQPSLCLLGKITSAVLAVAAGAASRELLPLHQGLFGLEASLEHLLIAGFPLFGGLEWLSWQAQGGAVEMPASCSDKGSQEFHNALLHHLFEETPLPALQALEYMEPVAAAAGAAGADRVSHRWEATSDAVAAAAATTTATPTGNQTCFLGRAAALISLALSLAPDTNNDDFPNEIWNLVGRAERALRQAAISPEHELVTFGHQWPIWTLLHRLSRAFVRPRIPQHVHDGCVVMMYVFPTSEIKEDMTKALEALDKHFFAHLHVRYPLIVFTDAETAPVLVQEFGSLTTVPLIPAIIPSDELTRNMLSFSCVDGINCIAGRTLDSSAHRGVINATQFWSADYLRISRYTAGPLFRHTALDQCSHFLKIDTDFFLTAPVEQDPIAEMRDEGSRLAYWQIHVQGQRQEGYMESALGFLQEHGLPIRNRAFYARGRFEEKAEKLGIHASDVPEALEVATVVYGCLFGGEVRFFREPLYQRFFTYMDSFRGFEFRGWSNQFFLGTAAAAFLAPSQVRRLYISGQHQDSTIAVKGGNVTEFLLGASKSVFR